MALVKLPGTPGRGRRVVQYTKNVGRSFGYALYDMVAETNPVIKDLIENSKEAAEDLYNSIDQIKSDDKNIEFINNMKGGSKAILKNLMDDLKTGNWYNKSRQEKLQADMMADSGDDFGFDMGEDEDWGDDWDVDNDDWGSDDDWGEEESTKAIVSEQEKSTSKIITAMDSVGFGVATAVNRGTVESANFLAKSGRENTSAIMKQNQAGFTALAGTMANVNNSIVSLAKIATPLSTHMQNASTFFTNTTEQLNKITEKLETIAQNTTKPKAAGSNVPTTFSSLLSADDVLDPSSWLNMVKKNMSEDKELMDMFTGVIKKLDPKNISIGTLMTQTITGYMIPKAFKEAMKGFNETLKYSMNAAFLKGRRNGLGGEGPLGWIGAFIGQYLFPEDRLKTKVNTSRYEKGPVSWDGYAKKALTDVIPTYLAKIYSAVSGTEETRYDYNKGTFVSVRSVKKTREKELREQYRNAGGNYRLDALGDIKDMYGTKGSATYDKIKYKQMVKRVNQYFEWAIKTGNPFNVNDFKKKYGDDNITTEVLSVFNRLREEYRASTDDAEMFNTANKWLTDIALTRDKISQATDFEEESGVSILNVLADGSYYKEGKNGKMKKAGVKSLKKLSGLMEFVKKDKYGNTMMNYLQGIYQYSASIFELLNLTNGGSGTGSGNLHHINPTTIGHIDAEVYADAKAKKQTKKAKKQYNKQEQAAQEFKNQYGSVDAYLESFGIRSGTKANGKKVYYTGSKNKGNRKAVSKKEINKLLKDAGYPTLDTLDNPTGTPGGTETRAQKRARQQANEEFLNQQENSGFRKFKNKVEDYFTENGVNVKSIMGAPVAALTSVMNSMAIGLSKLMWGEDGNPDSGLFGMFKDKAMEAFDWLKEAWQKHLDEDLSGLGEKLFGKKGEDGTREGGFFSNFINETKGSLREGLGYVGETIGSHWYGARYKEIKEARQYEKILKRYQDQMKAQQQGVEQAAFGRPVTKTGLIAVSEGELIIPSELNPYYHGVTNKAKQLKNERRAIKRFYGSFAPGGTVGKPEYIVRDGTKFKASINGVLEDISAMAAAKYAAQGVPYAQVGKDYKAIKNNLKDQVFGDKDSDTGYRYAREIADNTKNVISETMARLFGDEKDIDKSKKDIIAKTSSAIDEATEHKGAIGAGAVIGAGASLLTGAFVGPLAGAAIGAAVGLTVKSEKVQNLLFGNFDDEEGSDGTGLFSAEMSNFMKKNLPSTAMGGAAGMIGGLFLGSPFLGAIVGSGIGYIKSSESAKKFLFGDENEDGALMSKETMDKVKKAIPAMGTGALAGMIAGPFGLAGNLILGAGIGYLSTSDSFKKKMLGDEETGEEGLLGAFRHRVIDKLSDLAINTTKAVTNWLRRTGKRLTSVITSIAKGALGLGKKLFEKAINSKHPVIRAIAGATKAVGGRALDTLANVSTRSKAVNIRKGYGVYDSKLKRNLTAAEMLQVAEDNPNNKHIKKMSAQQKQAYQALAGIEDLDELKKVTRATSMLDKYKYFGTAIGDQDMETLRNMGIDIFEDDDKTKISKDKLKKLNTTGLKDLARGEKGRLKDPQKQTENFQMDLRKKTGLLVSMIGAIASKVTGHDFSEDIKEINKIKGETRVDDPQASLLARMQAKYGKSNAEVLGKQSNDDYVDEDGIVRNADGTVDNSNSENKEKLEEREQKNNALFKIPIIGTGIVSIQNLLTRLTNKLIGDEKDEKKKGILDILKDKLFGEGTGILNGMMQFLTGSPIGVAIKGVTKGLSLKGVITSFIGPALFGAAITGKFDDILGSILDKIPGVKGEDTDNPMTMNSTVKVTTADGEEVEVETDKKGNPKKNAAGTAYIATDGREIPIVGSKITTMHQQDGRISTGLKKDTLRGILTQGRQASVGGVVLNRFKNSEGGKLLGRIGGGLKKGGSKLYNYLTRNSTANLAARATDFNSNLVNLIDDPNLYSDMLVDIGTKEGRTLMSESGVIAKTAEKFATSNSKVARLAGKALGASDDVLRGIKGSIGSVFKAIGKAISKVPFMPKGVGAAFMTSIDDLVEGIAKAAGPKLVKLGTEVGKVLPVLNAVYIVGKAINSWGNAETILGITDKATIKQRIIATLIGTTTALIPFAEIIPDKVYVNLFIDIVAPKLGFDVSELKEQRERAGAIAEEAGYGSVEEYNKAQGRAGIFTKGFEETKKFITNVKDQFGARMATKEDKSLKTKAQVAGEVIKEGIAGVATKAGDKFKETFKPLIDKVSGSIKFVTDQVAYGANFYKTDNVKFTDYMKVPDTNEKGNPISGFAKAVILVSRIAGFGGVIVKKVAGDLWSGIKDVAGKIGTTASSFVKGRVELTKYALTGHPIEMMTYGTEAPEEVPVVGPIFSVVDTIQKTMLFPVSMVTLVGRKIGEGVLAVVDKVKKSASTVQDTRSKMAELAEQGDAEGIFKLKLETHTDDAGNPLGGFNGAILGLSSWFYQAKASFVKLGMNIGDAWDKLTGSFADDSKLLSTAQIQLKDYAKDNDLTSITRMSVPNFRSLGSPIFRFFYRFNWLTSLLGVGISGLWNGAKDWIGDKIDSLAEGAKNWVNGESDSTHQTSTASSFGSSFLQTDPRYANMPYAGGTFGQKGCGPAAAVNLARSYGVNLTPNEAIGFSGGYQDNIGTKSNYFNDVFAAKGVKLSGTTNKNEIARRLAASGSMILAGEDMSNTSKARSPFKYPHYVVAHGFDANGNIITEDSETGMRTYDPSILNHVKYAVGAGFSGGMVAGEDGKTGDMNVTKGKAPKSKKKASSSSGGKVDGHLMIWHFLKKHGFNDIGAAGVMGSWNGESANKPRRLEGDYLAKFPGYDKLIGNQAAMDDWVANGLGKKGNKHYQVDGHYYPGFGLAQWTAGRTKALFEYANKKNMPWDNLGVQLHFAANELKNSYYGKARDQVNAASNPRAAVPLWMKRYEGNTTYAYDPKRLAAAEKFYNKYKGTTYSGNIDKDVLNKIAYYPDGTTSGSTSGSISSSDTLGSSTGATATDPYDTKSLNGIMSIVTDLFTGMLGGTVMDATASEQPTTDDQNNQTVTGSSQGISGDMAHGFPYFNQGDSRWGGKAYGSHGTIKSSGCGPTSMAMVLSSYGKNVDPAQSAAYSVKNGYRASVGTGWGFFGNIGKAYGLETTQYNNAERTKQYLQKGIPVIASMRPGHFTKGGHFMVLAGLNGNQVYVNDPGSRDRTNQTWSLSTVTNEAKQYWAISNKGKGSIGNASKPGTSGGGFYMSAAGSGLVGNDATRTLSRARFYPSGAGSNMVYYTAAGKTTPVNVTNVSANVKSGGVKSNILNELLRSISSLLSSVASNTVPIKEIYDLLAEYLTNSSATAQMTDAQRERIENKINVINKKLESSDKGVSDSLSDLVSKLSEIAQG